MYIGEQYVLDISVFILNFGLYLIIVFRSKLYIMGIFEVQSKEVAMKPSDYRGE